MASKTEKRLAKLDSMTTEELMSELDRKVTDRKRSNTKSMSGWDKPTKTPTKRTKVTPEMVTDIYKGRMKGSGDTMLAKKKKK